MEKKRKKTVLSVALGTLLIFGASISMSSASPGDFWGALQNHKVGGSEQQAKKVAHWECYHCGKAATSEASNPDSPEPKAYPPGGNEACPQRDSGSHEWVWKSGVPQAKPEFSHFQCDHCGERVKNPNPVQGLANPPKDVAPCRKSQNGEHKWQRLPIW